MRQLRDLIEKLRLVEASVAYDSYKPTAKGDISKALQVVKGAPEEPEKKKKKRTKEGLGISAGCVVVPSLHPDDLNFCYIIKPSNNYGPWAFPKGGVDGNETFPEAARREVREETGIVCAILPGGYLGKGMGRTTVTHYFMAVQTGGSTKHDDEVEEVRLASFEEAWKLFAGAGNKRDIEILKKAWSFTDKLRGRSAVRTLGEPKMGSETPRPRDPEVRSKK